MRALVHLAALVMVAVSPADEPLRWKQLAPLPSKLGLAGAFVGVSGDALLVAGGANFPDKMPWDGGTKVWHDDVFVLEKPDGAWRTAGKLPQPLGYGVAVSHSRGLVCVGGSDAQKHRQPGNDHALHLAPVDTALAAGRLRQ